MGVPTVYLCLSCGDPLPAGRGGHCDSCVEWMDDPDYISTGDYSAIASASEALQLGDTVDDDPEAQCRAQLPIGHLRRDLFAPIRFCDCGAQATIIVYNPVDDVFLCDRCHAAYDSVLAATDRARERVLAAL